MSKRLTAAEFVKLVHRYSAIEDTLLLIQGVPGSGKTTLARRLGKMEDVEVHEADDFFSSEGGYKFNPKLLHRAHEKCFEDTRESIYQDAAAIVSNTFTRDWEIEPYARLAYESGLKFMLVRMETMFENIHNVPEEKVEQMRARMEKSTYIPDIVIVG